MKSRILFICKNRERPYDGDPSQNYSWGGGKSSGLHNSVKFMVDMLVASGVEAKLVDVADNNAIDREVALYKPTHVIIEALWVVPEKFTILSKLHPKVKWFIRLHSEIPFISNEGMAFDWLKDYVNYPNVYIAANSKRIAKDLKDVLGKDVAYLPNYYPVENFADNTYFEILEDDSIHIGCFGAIRPLKNQLIQAVAAIRFANILEKNLYFHINGNRVEGKGDPVLRNIQALFDSQPDHNLVAHDWMPHGKFLDVLGDMDLTMQVSFTETYNIVAADAVSMNVPTVTSKEITFINREFHADPTSTDDIVNALGRAYIAGDEGAALNAEGLKLDAHNAKVQWLSIFHPEDKVHQNPSHHLKHRKHH